MAPWGSRGREGKTKGAGACGAAVGDIASAPRLPESTAAVLPVAGLQFRPRALSGGAEEVLPLGCVNCPTLCTLCCVRTKKCKFIFLSLQEAT